MSFLLCLRFSLYIKIKFNVFLIKEFSPILKKFLNKYTQRLKKAFFFHQIHFFHNTERSLSVCYL